MINRRKMERMMTSFKNEEEYYHDLVGWGKQWILKYCNMATEVQPDGELTGIKDRLIFGHELAELCEPSFTDINIKLFRDFTKKMLMDMEQIHQRGANIATLEYLYRIYKFTKFEWFMIVMAFLVELEPQFERVFCLLQDDYAKKEPSVELCIQLFTFEEERKHKCQKHVIRRWDVLSNVFAGWAERAMIEPGQGSMFSSPLKLDDRIIRFLFDKQSEDLVFKDSMKLYLPHGELLPMLVRNEQVDKLARRYQEAKGGFVYLSGAKGIGKKFLVFHYCKQEGKRLCLVNAAKLIAELTASRQTVKRLIREAHLQQNAVLCFDDIALKEPAHMKLFELILSEMEEELAVPIFLSPEKWDVRLGDKGTFCKELVLEPVSVEEREILWQGLLAGMEFEEEVQIEQLADRYQLTPGAIALAVGEVKKQQAEGEGREQKALFQAAQSQLVHKLGNDAVRISVQYTMKDLILPAPQKELIKNACNLVAYRHLVYNQWGFGSKIAYGRGVNMIFYGPPGTGKTMGAQSVAGELNMEIYRVDMSNVLSKYVGESEKKLGNIFEQGEKSQSILFFDEADALFGKRSEVKDAQDKYANASTAYLLQKIEEYQGVVILATNLLQNFDTAFARRFQFIIEFPMPDTSHRMKIWKSVFPKELPLEESIDFEYLSEQFVFSGSQIKSIALASAFLAAGEQKKLSMRFILESIKREMKKIGKNMIGNDFGKYCSLMEE